MEKIASLFSTAAQNLSFVLTCIAIFGVLVAIAVVCEKSFCHGVRDFKDTHYIAYSAIFAAMAGVLMLVEIPLFFAPSFYKMDLSEIPIMICTFYLGPVAGVVTELIKIIIKLILKGTGTAFVGDFANFAVGCAFVLPASVIYHAKPGRKAALVGMLVGTAVMSVFGSAFNAIYLLPKFSDLYGMPIEVIVDMGTKINPAITSVWTMAAFAVAPFNILKGAIVSLLTFLLYKRISPLLKKGDVRMQSRKNK